jgi:hypothetical protein
MFNKLLIFAIVFGCSISAFSQNSVNDYKYVIVPNDYDFLDEEDEFRINSLTKFLFEKYGFIALMEDENRPIDLMYNPCLALKADVLDDSGTFKTKLAIELKNCNDELIFVSEQGESFDKKYAIAYNKALRDAFMYVAALKYSYKPNEYILSQKREDEVDANQEIDELKEEIEVLKKEKETILASETAAELNAEEIVEKTNEQIEISLQGESTLYAQKTEYGYQVVDSTPKVVMVLLNTKNPEVYMVKGRNAMVIKEEGSWYLSENNGSEVKNTLIEIKF